MNFLTFTQAKGITLLFKKLIGTEPTIYVIKDGIKPGVDIYQIQFDEQQKKAMIEYLDKQVFSFFRKPGEIAPKQLQIDLDGILLPFSVKYLTPALIGCFLLGRLSKK